MELSPYNTLVKVDEGDHLAFNQVSGTLLRVSPQVYAYLNGGTQPGWTGTLFKQLVDGRFLVDSRETESERVKTRMLAWRANRQAVHFSLVLTYACNLRCPYCYEEDIRRRNRPMSQKTAAAAVDRMIAECSENEAEFLGLTLYGGEPMLNLGVMQYVVDRLRRWCTAEGITFDANLITNGTRTREEEITPLLPSLKTVQLTLDGAREHHDRVRTDGNGHGTFNRVLDGADRFLGLGVRVMFRIQLTPEAYDTIDDCLRQLQARGLLNRPDVGLYFFPIMDVGGVCSAKSFSCYKQYFSRPLIERLGKVAEGFQLQPFRLPQPVWQQPYCSFVNRHAWLIDPRGDCYKCVSMIGRPEYRAGSVWPDEHAGQHAAFQAVADDFVQRSGAAIESCRRCEFLPSCDGGCAYRALVTTGDMAQPCCEMHGEAQREQIRATYRACGRGDG